MKLRNAVTPLMKEDGYGQGYKYAHDFDDAIVPGERYLPDELEGTVLYEPSPRGDEAKVAERLRSIRSESKK